jgi:hypothetical protein
MAPLVLLLFAFPALAADSPPDSTSRVPILQVFLRGGGVLQAQRVMQNSLGMVTVTLMSGRDSVIAANDVRSVMDEVGKDRTKHVLVDSEVLRAGDAAAAEKEKKKKYAMPANEKGTYLSVHAGPASPTGSFGNVAATGFEVDASAHLRRGKRTVLGLRLEYSQFGGTEEFENFLYSIGNGGEVDQLSFRSLGASFYVRSLIFRQPRFDPFLYLSIGAGRFTTELSGPGASGSHPEFAFHEEYGLGVHWKTSERTGVELMAAIANFSTDNGRTLAGDTALYTAGTNTHTLLKVGIVRRYGGGD